VIQTIKNFCVYYCRLVTGRPSGFDDAGLPPIDHGFHTPEMIESLQRRALHPH